MQKQLQNIAICGTYVCVYVHTYILTYIPIWIYRHTVYAPSLRESVNNATFALVTLENRRRYSKYVCYIHAYKCPHTNTVGTDNT